MYIYMNGKLLTHNIYEDSQLIKNIKYEYKCDTIAVLNAWFQDYCNMGDIGTYHVPIGHCRIERETEGCFDTRSLTKYWKTTRYKQYNPHNYLPSEISVDDGLKEKTVRTIYTVDLDHIPLYNEMCGNTGNRITDPVEIRTYDNSGLIQKELHTYKKMRKTGVSYPMPCITITGDLRDRQAILTGVIFLSTGYPTICSLVMINMIMLSK